MFNRKLLEVNGSALISHSSNDDDRGSFSRLYCQEDMAAIELDSHVNQVNLSYTKRKGTLRGLHYQVGLNSESKLIKVLDGAIFDVVVDMRSNSSTYFKTTENIISASDNVMIYVPAGCAHGVLTLEKDTRFMYLTSKKYDPLSERGIRWNDPSININWPIRPKFISDKDLNWNDYKN